MERIALNLGWFKIYWYSIFIFLGVIAACTVIFLESKKKDISREFMTNLVLNTIIIGFLGARIYYCIFHLSYYINHPLEIIQIWNGGLAIHGGILFGGFFFFYYCRKHKIELFKILDIVVVGVILGQVIGRWGNFFNQEAYGLVTSLSFLQSLHLPKFIIEGMYILGEYRQPTFLYESLWNFIGFLVLLGLRKYPKLKAGQLSGVYFMWYSLARFIIEGIRIDSLMIGPFRVAQLASIFLFIFGAVLFLCSDKIKNHK